jgi:NAD(P)-dependent dehydrogenase (short-subunit alcohol dehydrogenase family)
MSKHGDWTQHDIPDQTGKIAIVTGANSGIGFEAARELARRGAEVVLACRSETKAAEAIAQIRGDIPTAKLEFMALDLADLDQVRSFAAQVHERYEQLDLLINNAGVMIPPASKTKQGFELQLGVNHLGHFAVTGLVLDLLLARPGARVVTVSSQAHRQGKIFFDDLDFDKRGYKPMLAYGQSKLANLLFTFELARRLKAAGLTVPRRALGSTGLLVAAAHPGWTATNLQQHNGLIDRINPIFGMKPLAGALPTLRAATDPAVESGDYYGPDGLFEMRGAPVKVGTTRRAKDPVAAARLWEISEQRTGVRYEFDQATAAA